jgi:hypothetical protein
MIELKRGRVVHDVPGRLRVKLNREELTEEFSRELRAALTAVHGVLDVRSNPRTGSVVIHYDAAELDAGGLIDLARAANLLALEALADDPYAARRVPTSLTAQRIKRTFHEVDVRLSELSSGRWDLRSVVPVAFGALAVRQIIRDFGQLGVAPWYVLAWYAFDSFWKLNQERHHAADLPEPPLILPSEE